ncbi:MAG: hypothetical protein AAFU79_23995, partial [Myxococcota bacterium]
MFELVDLLHRRGRLDSHFFDRLIEARPDRADRTKRLSADILAVSEMKSADLDSDGATQTSEGGEALSGWARATVAVIVAVAFAMGYTVYNQLVPDTRTVSRCQITTRLGTRLMAEPEVGGSPLLSVPSDEELVPTRTLARSKHLYYYWATYKGRSGWLADIFVSESTAGCHE